jgi:hypothetical protein
MDWMRLPTDQGSNEKRGEEGLENMLLINQVYLHTFNNQMAITGRCITIQKLKMTMMKIVPGEPAPSLLSLLLIPCVD